jgi:hypothetical protein
MRKVPVMVIIAVMAMSVQALGANSIANGDFELGKTDFTSQYTYVATTGPEALWLEAHYAVGYNPGDYHYLWDQNGGSYGDHTTVSGLMLIVNGAEFVTPGSEPTVWEQTGIPVVPGIDYVFTYYLRTCYPASPATLKCTINDVQFGTATAPDEPSDGWLEVSYPWNSGSATIVDIRLIDLNYEHTGNDFTIDDISLVNTEPVGYDSATGCTNAEDGTGSPIKSKGTWFMYNEYPEDGGDNCYPIQAGNPEDGVNIIGEYCITDNGDDTYTAIYDIDDTIEINGVTYDIVVTSEHLAHSDTMNFTGKPGQDDNADFGIFFYDENGNFYIFAHFTVEYW